MSRQPVHGRDLLVDLALSRAVVDRAAHHRLDEAWLDAAWASPHTRLLRVSHGKVAVVGDPPVLALDPVRDAAEGERYFLGVDADGSPYFAVAVGAPDPSYRSLREVGVLLPALDAGLVVHAVALANWHATHTHCPRCGARTVIAAAGHLRRCEADGSEHFPRTDPAVIMAVVDGEDRLLLGRQVSWPEGRFSTLAGFVEPGESLEAAVRREVAEEVGIGVGAVHYLGSQPWPFPASLMLGFVAVAEDTDVRPVDGEIAEARWFTRAGLRQAIGAGEVRPSPSISISRRLIEHWYGGALPDPPTPW